MESWMLMDFRSSTWMDGDGFIEDLGPDSLFGFFPSWEM